MIVIETMTRDDILKRREGRPKLTGLSSGVPRRGLRGVRTPPIGV